MFLLLNFNNIIIPSEKISFSLIVLILLLKSSSFDKNVFFKKELRSNLLFNLLNIIKGSLLLILFFNSLIKLSILSL